MTKSFNRSYSKRSRSPSRRRSYNDAKIRRTRSRSPPTKRPLDYKRDNHSSIKTSSSQKDDNSKKQKFEDDEDLEEFYNKLKQKAANKAKK